MVAASFQPATDGLQGLPLGRLVFGHWHHGDVSEEVIVVRLRDGQVDITCHGGQAAAESIISVLVESGAVACTPQEWVNGIASDAIEAEVLPLLAAAETKRTTAILLDQYRGALRETLDAVQAAVDAGRVEDAAATLKSLLLTAEVGLRVADRWKVVVAGPPNAGKSSLVNALVGYDRAIVFDQAGTTRDRVAVQTAFDGWPVELIDTAGLRSAEDPLEAAGVALARQELSQADLILWVTDVSADSRTPPPTSENTPVLLVANKADLISASDSMEGAWLLTSAVDGTGIERLQTMISDQLVKTPPPPGAGVIFTERQRRCIEAAVHAFSSGDLGLASRFIGDVLGDRQRC